MATPRTWYLLAYDIRDPKRLQRVHYYLRKRALAVQQSVFFLHVTDTELKQVLDEVAARIHRQRDDVRAYPISLPTEIWEAGQSMLAGPLLRPRDSAPSPSQRPVASSPSIWKLATRWWRKSLDIFPTLKDGDC